MLAFCSGGTETAGSVEESPSLVPGSSSVVFGGEQAPSADGGDTELGSLLADRLKQYFPRSAIVNTSSVSPGPLVI